MSPFLLGVLALTLSASSTAQPIWRCGPGGSHFQATPCHDGAPLSLKPMPTDEAVQEARNVAQRERLALQTLGEQRRLRERDALARGFGPAGVKPLPSAVPPKAPSKEASSRKAMSWPPAKPGA